MSQIHVQTKFSCSFLFYISIFNFFCCFVVDIQERDGKDSRIQRMNF